MTTDEAKIILAGAYRICVDDDEEEKQRTEFVNQAIDVLTDQPEIVRCKNCKYFTGEGCSRFPKIVITSIDWFCADGKRKD